MKEVQKMKVIELVEKLPKETMVEIVDCFDILHYYGKSEDLKIENFPVLQDKEVIKILSIKERSLKILFAIF